MRYRFLLKLLYRADSKNEAWTFRPLIQKDLYYISEWIALATGIPDDQRRILHEQLLHEFSITAGPLRRSSSYSGRWMVMVKDNRSFSFEVDDTSGDADVTLIAPPILLEQYRPAFIVWRRITAWLIAANAWPALRVYLEDFRQIEAQVLEDLGFVKQGTWSAEGAWYVLRSRQPPERPFRPRLRFPPINFRNFAVQCKRRRRIRISGI